MEGRLADARRAAQRLVAYVTSHLNDPFMESMLPMSEQYMPTTMLVLVRFHQWRDILAVTQPEAKLQVTNGLWHFGRGWAFAAEGSTDKAEQELQSLLAIKNKISGEAMINLNKAGPVLGLAEKFLSAKIAEAKMQNATAIQFLEEATTIEDSLAYDEPPAWYIPSREALGGILLRDGQWDAAERAFRADLEKNKLNGRSLFGLMESLKAQKKTREARLAGRQYAVAWRNADTKLTIAGL
jgi:tetratricopeptide (TPR) repeat protein